MCVDRSALKGCQKKDMKLSNWISRFPYFLFFFFVGGDFVYSNRLTQCCHFLFFSPSPWTCFFLSRKPWANDFSDSEFSI